MYTRQQYLNNECTFSEYYQQFVTNQTKRLVLDIGLKRIKDALNNGDKHLNTIPLYKWDNLALFFRCDSQMKECGDFTTLAGKVCILKETARELANEYNN